MPKERLRWLESQLNKDNLSDQEFDLYNKEANELQAAINLQKEEIKKKKELALTKEIEDKKEEFLRSLTDEQVEEMYKTAHEKYAGDINGMSFEEWFDQAKSFYTIDGNFVVHSSARSPKEENTDSVPCYTEAHARYRVLKLILTKLNDHGNRGYDFRWINKESLCKEEKKK